MNKLYFLAIILILAYLLWPKPSVPEARWTPRVPDHYDEMESRLRRLEQWREAEERHQMFERDFRWSY